MLILRFLRSAARAESGFTLIELVVAMLISGVIVVVLLTVLTFTTTQTSLLTEKVQSNRTGRETMTKVLDELHSACIASGSTGYYPVREGSTPSKLIFYNAYSKQPAISSASESPSEGVYKHEITFTESSGKLVDSPVPSSSVSAWPALTFGSAKPAVLLGENLSKTPAPPSESEPAPPPLPIFEYLEYSEAGASTSSETAGLDTLEQIPWESKEVLTEKQAQKVAAVLVRFTASPAGHNQKLNRSISLSSQVTFAFTSPNAENTISAVPCE
jgi:prepilin-type N-terminal cleavage/methylation domain-containing protein